MLILRENCHTFSAVLLHFSDSGLHWLYSILMVYSEGKETILCSTDDLHVRYSVTYTFERIENFKFHFLQQFREKLLIPYFLDHNNVPDSCVSPLTIMTLGSPVLSVFVDTSCNET